MTYGSRALRLLILVLLASGRLDASDCNPVDPHVRTVDRQLADVLDEAWRRSATFRTLLERIQASNVIVYVEFQSLSQGGPAGYLSFVTAAGGWRYVRIRVCRCLSRLQLIALIGHELRHATEIAEAPDVVDSASMACLYQRIGFESTESGSRSHDTMAAVEAGRRIAEDLRNGATRVRFEPDQVDPVAIKGSRSRRGRCRPFQRVD